MHEMVNLENLYKFMVPQRNMLSQCFMRDHQFAADTARMRNGKHKEGKANERKRKRKGKEFKL